MRRGTREPLAVLQPIVPGRLPLVALGSRRAQASEDGGQPPAPLAPINTKTDRRHDRGSLSQDEFDTLIRTTPPAQAFRGLSGDDRAIHYLVAAYTGLRASELAILTPSGFDLDSEPPTVRVKAAYTKNGDEALLPLRPDLVEALRPYLEGKPSGSPVWPGTWVMRSARMLRNDLERAGIAYIDSEGRYRDFHSLRHRLGSELAKANVPPKVAQTLTRHSTITLTMDRYAHVQMFDTAGAVGKLPPLPGPRIPPESAPMQATGTDGQPINELLAHYLPTAGDVSGRSESDSDVMAQSGDQMRMDRNPLLVTALDAERRPLTVPVASSGGGTRTPDTRIMIPPAA